jgi:hypothetical protein
MKRVQRKRTAPHARVTVAAILLAGSAALAACTVVESYRIPAVASDPERGTPCASRLGSYSLPRGLLRVQVGTTAESKKPGIVKLDTVDVPVKVIRHPDPALTFCLDHVSSYTADDKIDVVKWPVTDTSVSTKGSILGAMTVNATDQSVYIINSLIRALFIFVSGDPNFTTRRALITSPVATLADLEYDPFNPTESASINARLSKLGYCLVLESYTFDTKRVGLDQYCNNPERYGQVPTMVTKAYMRVAAEPMNPKLPGIHYRPRYPYRLMIFYRSDRTGRWELDRMDTVELENMSPVMTLAVGRSTFAARSAYFLFEEGALKTACVSKGSELEGFVKIPLEISRAIVELPGAIFKIQIDQFSNLDALAKVEQQLFLAQKAQIAAALGGTYTAPPNSPTTYTDQNPTVTGIALPGTFGTGWKLDHRTYPDVLGEKLSELCSGDGKL